MEILRLIGAACSGGGNGPTVRGGERMRDGAAFEDRQQETCGGKFEFLTSDEGI